MPGAKRVVLALAPLEEAGEPALLAQRLHSGVPAGEQLVWISLMTDVPHQLVARGLEDVVQRDRQLDDTEPGADVSPRSRTDVDQSRPHLGGEGAKFLAVQAPKVGGARDTVQNCHSGKCTD